MSHVFSSEDIYHTQKVKSNSSVHRTAEWLQLLGISKVQSLVTLKQGATTAYCWVLTISRDRDYPTSLDNLCQYLVTVRIWRKKKKCFLMFKQNFLYIHLCPLPPVLSLDTTEKTLICPSLLAHTLVFTVVRLSLLFPRLKYPCCRLSWALAQSCITPHQEVLRKQNHCQFTFPMAILLRRRLDIQKHFFM